MTRMPSIPSTIRCASSELLVVTFSPSSRTPFVNRRTVAETSNMPTATRSVSLHDIRNRSATYTATVLVVTNRCTRILSASLVRQVSDASTFRRRPERSRSMAPKLMVSSCPKMRRRR